MATIVGKVKAITTTKGETKSNFYETFLSLPFLLLAQQSAIHLYTHWYLCTLGISKKIRVDFSFQLCFTHNPIETNNQTLTHSRSYFLYFLFVCISFSYFFSARSSFTIPIRRSNAWWFYDYVVENVYTCSLFL